MLPHRDERTGRLIMAKADLVDGAYYVGRCRNATIARWSGGSFFHWREKMGRIYVEEIKHPIDEEYFDVFRVVRVLAASKFAIPFDVAATFEGHVEDLHEYDHEMWSKL